MKQYKTPLRYPGGKSRACIKLDTFFPDLSKYSEFREPFLGGGSVAIHVTKKYPKIKIWVNDLYEPLTNFWQQLQHALCFVANFRHCVQPLSKLIDFEPIETMVQIPLKNMQIFYKLIF